MNLSGGNGGTCYDSGRSGTASSGGAGNVWIRANEVTLSGSITATYVRIDALDITSSRSYIAGNTDGIPAAIEYYQDSSGVVHVTNNSSDTVVMSVTR